ncbi:MAG: hypothetical protein KatS3mg105_3101 [Gemmatales bacterium]|nr:MAG: hypothetical protein KatS3mg105_3101 [Gemmatales bacterium]
MGLRCFADSPTLDMRRYLASVILVGWGTASVAGPIDVDPEDLQPGLVAEYRSLVDGEARLARIDKKPAFYLGRSSPHPRLPAGPFEVAWSGMIFLKEETSYSFAAYVCGEVTVAIDGEIALRGKGSDDNSYLLSDHVFKRSFGLYRIEVTYRSLPNTPARLQLWWEGENFSREPLPAWQLFHLVKKLPASVLEQQQVDRGRELAADSGCARCHRSAFPGIEEPPPGPSLTHLGRRVSRAWLMHWLAEPTKIHEQTRMPALFTNDRNGFVERWLITDYLLGGEIRSTTQKLKGDHRSGRLTFLKVGCIACHASPEKDKVRKPGQIVFAGLKDRFDTSTLAEFLTNPHSRYPDGRMPALPLSKQEAIDVAEYLLLWSKASVGDKIDGAPPTARERNEMLSRLRVRRASDLGAALVRDKGCTQCHPGLDRLKPRNVAIRNADAGCLDDDSLPRFHLSPKEKQSLKRFLAIARRESHPSPFFARQKLVDRFGCLRCHQRDSETPPPLEQAGSTVAGAFLQYVPFQRTPKLTDAHQKYELAYLRRAIREGVEGLRPARYSYRMPRFGQHADAVVQALAEADGELPTGPLPKPRGKIDPTLGTQVGPNLAGFQGYSCVSCHVWKGQMLSSPDPGAVGTDLTKVKGRIRRDWFERFLENPRRFHPGTPMPAVFIKGKKATLTSILDGDPNRQKEALWAFLQLGSSAPSPKPLPPLPVPLSGSEPIVAQIPIRQSDGTYIESISILYPSHDLLVYDLAAGGLQQVYIGAQIGREVQGRLRRFLIVGRPVGTGFLHRPVLQLRTATKTERIKELHLHYYDRLPDGVRIRHRVLFESGAIDIAETLRLSKRELVREYQSNGIPKDCRLLVSTATPCPTDFKVAVGRAEVEREKSVLSASLQANEKNQAEWVLRYSLPEAEKTAACSRQGIADHRSQRRVAGASRLPGHRLSASENGGGRRSHHALCSGH